MPPGLARCYRLAGVLGIDPAGFSLRELTVMAEARDRDQWDRLAWLLAEIDNAGKSLARCFCEEEIEPTLPDDKSLYVLIAEAEKEEAAGKAKRPRRAPGVAEYDPRVLQARQDRATKK